MVTCQLKDVSVIKRIGENGIDMCDAVNPILIYRRLTLRYIPDFTYVTDLLSEKVENISI